MIPTKFIIFFQHVRFSLVFLTILLYVFLDIVVLLLVVGPFLCRSDPPTSEFKPWIFSDRGPEGRLHPEWKQGRLSSTCFI